MEKYADLIFKKLHSDMNQEEKLLFDKLYAENQFFLQAFEKQKFVDEAIEKTNLVQAPNELKAKVLNVVLNQKPYSETYASFGGFKYIIGLLSSSSLLMISFVLTRVATTGTSPQGIIKYFNVDKMVETFSFLLDKNTLPLALIFITGLLLVWMDRLYQSKVFGFNKSY